MNTFEIVFLSLVILGFGYLLYFFLKDPGFAIRSFLRSLLYNSNPILILVFFPVWFPAWIIDKIFKLKIYYKEVEDVSEPVVIDFSLYGKYMIVNTEDKTHIEYIIRSFNKSFDPVEFNFSLKDSQIYKANYKKSTVLKFEGNTSFSTFKVMMNFIENSALQNKIYNVKGILIHKAEREKSFYILIETGDIWKFPGRTYDNRKMYVELLKEERNGDHIYFNPNIEKLDKFDFDTFISEENQLIYKSI